MKLYYHLPSITYDYTNLCFKDFTHNEALGYLKIVFKNPINFQRHFLSKMENIPNLQELCIELGNSFEKANPLTKNQIEKLHDEDCRNLALDHYKGLFDLPKEKNKPKSSYFDKYVQKIKDFLDDAEAEEEFHPFYFSDLLDNKAPFILSKIKKYNIEDKQEFIHFTVNNVEGLQLNDAIRYFVCSKGDIKNIELNKGLLYLDASNNRIKDISLNDNLIELDIDHNSLTQLKCNPNLKKLSVSNNKLQKLQLNEKLEELVCFNNELERLELNDCLKEATIRNNPISYIKLNKKLLELDIDNSDNKFIEIDNSIENNQVVINYYLK